VSEPVPGRAGESATGPERAGARVSRTSQAVAVTRAGFDRPHSPDGDPDAQRKLCAGMASVVLTDMAPSLAARTRFFDDQVIAAIGTGIRQVVILGAGYDDRAMRFATAGVRFFELDHPGTQADKRARVAALGADGADGAARLVAADFRTDDVAAALAAAGHDAAAPTLFVCEGLLVYFDAEPIVAFLASVRAAAAAGSVLAASLAIHADGLDSARVLEVANARRRTARDEPWRTILPAAEHAGLLTRAGWDVTSAADAAGLGTGAEPGRSLLVAARPAT
jgi:methyltransferase (TIGR00027 family)